MVRGRTQGRGQPVENPNPDFMAVLTSIQQRLDEQAAFMQQQGETIRNLQQLQERIMNPELDGFEDDGLDDGQGNLGNGRNNNEGNGVGDPPLRAPREHGPEILGNPQPQHMRREYLCERLGKMKPPSFEGSTNPLDAEEWLSSMETILDFIELNDRERIICAAFMLKREARYWWESVKARRNIRTMLWADFVYEFKKKFFNPTALSAQQTEFLSLK